MINVEQANGKYPNGLQSVIATFVLQPPAAMGLLPLLLLLVVSSALATPVNIYDVNYDPMLGTNFANDFSQNSLSLGDSTYGQRLGNSTVLCESNAGDQVGIRV